MQYFWEGKRNKYYWFEATSNYKFNLGRLVNNFSEHFIDK